MENHCLCSTTLPPLRLARQPSIIVKSLISGRATGDNTSVPDFGINFWGLYRVLLALSTPAIEGLKFKLNDEWDSDKCIAQV